MKKVTIYTVQEVAKALRQYGFPVVEIQEPTEGLDGEVKISDAVSVQVGRGYLVVSKWLSEDEMLSYPERSAPAALVADIRQAM